MATGFNPFLFLVYTLDEQSFWLFFKFLFIFLIFEYLKQVARPIAIRSLPTASVISEANHTWAGCVSVCWKQGPPPQNPVLEPRNYSIQRREVNVQGGCCEHYLIFK